MLIFGSKMYFKSNVVKSFGTCEHCGIWGKQVSYQARNCAHLYFIPIIPMSGRIQVLKECKACSMGLQLPEKERGPIVESLSSQFKTWVTAVTEGKREVSPDIGIPPVNVGALIAGGLSDLYCLDELEEIQSLCDLLGDSGMNMERELVLGSWYELLGDLINAKLGYQAAHRIDPNSIYPLYQLGMTELKLGDLDSAETTFKKYLHLQPDDITVYIELSGAYEGAKNYPKIVRMYDKIYELAPQLVSDKRMRKVYKKACKKGAVQGKFLQQM